MSVKDVEESNDHWHAHPSLKVSQQVWEDDEKNPFNWPKSRKWRVTVLTALVTLLVGLNATAITTPGLAIAEEFHVSDEKFPHSFWPVTAWNTAAAFGPMLGLPLMENFGIRVGYLLSYAAFSIMIIPQAVAPNFATLIVTRVIAGALGGILQNAMATFNADMWMTDEERDLPVTLYTFVLVSGVTLGPVFGAIFHELSWRWVFYVQLIIYCAVFPLLLIIIPETRGAVILAKHAKKEAKLAAAARDDEKRQPQISALLFEAVTRPVHLLVTEPVVFFLALWTSFAFGLVFISTQSVAQVYSTNYGFSDAASGLVQVALFVGEIFGFIACLPQNKYYQHSATRNQAEPGVAIPEARLPLSIPAGLIGLAGGLFVYAWTSFPYLHWIIPTIGLALVGFGIMAVVNTVDLYITDSYAKYAGSAIAAVAFGENIFAAFLPLAAHSMYTVLGFQWASSLLGFVALVLVIAPIVLLFKGDKIRQKSKFISEASHT